MIQTNHKLIFLLVICFSCIKNGSSSFMIAEDKDSHCVGSIILNNNASLTFKSSVPEMNLVVWMVRMEGCGCYRLHPRTRGRGRSLRIFQQGITRVTMGRVRSIVTEQCLGGGNSIALYRKQSQALTDNSVRRINSALTRTTKTTISTRRISSPSTSSSATKMSTIKTPIKIQKIISAVRRRVMTK